MSALQYSCTDAAGGEGQHGGGNGGTGGAFVLPRGVHFVIPRYPRDCLQAVGAGQGHATVSSVLGRRQAGDTPHCSAGSLLVAKAAGWGTGCEAMPRRDVDLYDKPTSTSACLRACGSGSAPAARAVPHRLAQAPATVAARPTARAAACRHTAAGAGAAAAAPVSTSARGDDPPAGGRCKHLPLGRSGAAGSWW